MTPEAIRRVVQLRQEFYTLLAAKIQVPVNISRDNHSTTYRSMASWIDKRQQLNYLLVYPYIAPDALVPKRPFILKIAINRGAGSMGNAQWRKNCRGVNQSWHFELALLPEQILDFLPWIVSLIESQEHDSVLGREIPPHPLKLQLPEVNLGQKVWTQKAWQYYSDSQLIYF